MRLRRRRHNTDGPLVLRRDTAYLPWNTASENNARTVNPDRRRETSLKEGGHDWGIPSSSNGGGCRDRFVEYKCLQPIPKENGHNRGTAEIEICKEEIRETRGIG